MNKKLTLTIVTLGILVALGLVAFEKLKGPSAGDVKSKQPEIATAKDIKVGAILFLTGPQAPLGEEVHNALQLAVAELNDKGGIQGAKVKLAVEDSKDSPKDAIAAFNKLLIEKPPIIISTGDVVSLNLAPIASDYKQPLITTVAAGPGIPAKSPWAFRVWRQATDQGALIAEYAMRKLNVKKLAALSINNEFGDSSFGAFKETIERKGGEVVANETFGIMDRDVRAQVQKVIAVGPEAIYVTGFGDGYGTCIRQIREAGYKGLILADNTISITYFLEQTKGASEGIYFSSVLYDERSEDPRTANFIESYKQKYGSVPSFVGAFAYDAFGIVKEVLQSGARDPEAIRQALLSVKDYDGVTGRISFDDKGEMQLPSVIKRIDGGVPVIIEQVAP